MGGSRRDATLTVGLAGTQEVARGAEQALGPWERGARTVKGAFGDVRTAVGGAVASALQDIGHVVTAFGAISAGSAIREVRSYEDVTARMAVSTRTDLESVRKGFEDLGKEVGQKPQALVGFTEGVKSVTYDAQGAAQAIKGIAREAADADRPIESYGRLAAVLHNTGRVAGDTSKVLGSIRAQAEQFGTVGGPAALEDQIASLGDVISRFSVKGEKDFLRITNAAAALGKGLQPEAAQRVQAGALGAIASDPMRWERYLGRKITDEHGQVEDPARVMQEIVAKTRRRYGGRAERVLQLNFGAEVGSAMARTDFSQQAVGSGQSGALEHFLSTDAGQRVRAQAGRAGVMRSLFGSDSMVGRAADAFEQFTSSSSGAAVTGAAGAVIGTKLLAAGAGLLKGGGAAAGAAAGGGGGAAAAGAGATVAEGAGLAGGAGVAAVALPVAAFLATMGITFKGLSDLGAASAVKQGFSLRAIPPEEAKELSARAAAARQGAAGHMSPGMAEAYNLERARLEKRETARAALAAPDNRADALVRELVKQGADLRIAMQAAKEMIEAAPVGPVQVTIVNATGGPITVVDAQKASSKAGKQ